MGYGLGIFLMALGLILALAVDASLVGIDLQMIGWILAGAGLLVLIVTAVQLNAGRSRQTVVRRPHPGGSQSVEERGTRDRPPYA